MWTLNFWKQAIERAIKTLAQTLIALLGAGTTDLLDVDFGNSLAVSGLAALLSVLTSIASAGAGPQKGTASLVAIVPAGQPGHIA